MHAAPPFSIRTIAFQIAALVFLLGQCHAQVASQDTSTQTAELLAIEQTLLNAVGTGDTLAWKTYLDDSFLLVSEDGSRSTKAELLSSLHPFPRGYTGRINIVQPSIVFSGNLAIMHYVADEYETVFGQQLHTTYATMNVYTHDSTQWRLLSSQVFEIPKAPPRVAVSADVERAYVGTYEMGDSMTYTVTMNGKALYGSRNEKAPQELIPETDNIFFVTGDARGRKLFVKDANGTIQMLPRRNGEDIVWKRRR